MSIKIKKKETITWLRQSKGSHNKSKIGVYMFECWRRYIGLVVDLIEFPSYFPSQ